MARIFLCLTALLWCGHALADETVQRTEALITAFKAVKSPADEAAFTALDGFFDRERLTTEPIAPLADKLTEEQKKGFAERYWRIIRLVAYPDAGRFFEKAQWTLKPVAGKKDVALHARLVEEDLETDVVFHWHEAGGALRVYDVSFDGASLVKDYQNQFGRIVAKEGADGLLKKLDERLQKETEARAAAAP